MEVVQWWLLGNNWYRAHAPCGVVDSCSHILVYIIVVLVIIINNNFCWFILFYFLNGESRADCYVVNIMQLKSRRKHHKTVREEL